MIFLQETYCGVLLDTKHWMKQQFLDQLVVMSFQLCSLISSMEKGTYLHLCICISTIVTVGILAHMESQDWPTLCG